MLLIYGWDPDLYEREKKSSVRVLLEEKISLPDAIEPLFLQTPLEIEVVARKLAWETVFQKVTIFEGNGPKKYFDRFNKIFTNCHLAAHLLLSDGADYGVGALKNALLARRRKIRSIFGLTNAFKGIPAIICGAGPSLPKIEAYQNRALIFAGGAALDRIDGKPHFAAAIDKEGVLEKTLPEDLPFCFQSRLNPEVFSQIKGPLLRAPESHFPFLRWLEGEEEPFDGGWTVGNFLTALATLWGCNPIVLVGMDFCYRRGKKYAQDSTKTLCEGLVPFMNRKGEAVMTQKDWLMAAQWTAEWAQSHPDRQFIDGSGEGLDLSLVVKKLNFIDFPLIEGLGEKVSLAIEKTPNLKTANRWAQWRRELSLGGPLVEEKLLEPLWTLWRPIFAREVESERDLEIHRSLFFERVKGEHLNALR